MKILVTGGGGFLGKAIVRQLLERGDEVRIVARSDYPEVRDMGAETHRGDLGDPGVATEAAKGCDAIIHTAAKAGVWGDRKDYVRSNVTATEHILEACRANGIQKLVFTSSPSVTFDGGDAEGAGNDLSYPDDFLSFYPETKAAAEKLVLEANGPELMTVSLRPHLIWGPGDPHLIPRVVERARAGQLKIVGDGTNVVDLTYVENAAVAHLQALDALESHDSPPAGSAYFISDDDPVELWPWINNLLAKLEIPPVTSKVSPKLAYAAGSVLETGFRAFGITKKEPKMTRFVARQLATSHWYDMAPARRDFGYTPLVDPADGLERLIEDLS